MKHPVTLECVKHGLFILSLAETHFRKNGGCPKCWYNLRISNLKPGNVSKKEKEWLDTLNVPVRQEEINIGTKKFIVDGFDPTTNTVYEYNGSYWHGNPNIYKRDDINTVLGVTFGELYQKTLERETLIKKHYNLVVLWG